jgi:hypothetical protein
MSSSVQNYELDLFQDGEQRSGLAVQDCGEISALHHHGGGVLIMNSTQARVISLIIPKRRRLDVRRQSGPAASRFVFFFYKHENVQDGCF